MTQRPLMALGYEVHRLWLSRSKRGASCCNVARWLTESGLINREVTGTRQLIRLECRALHQTVWYVCLQKVVYTFTPIGLLLTALGVAWVVLVP